MFDHHDTLGGLADSAPLRDKLALVHSTLERRHPFVDRISVAIHDPETDVLKTFVASSMDDNPLEHYEARLADCGSLAETAARRRPRVVNDLRELGSEHEHSRRIGDHGYRASYTLPVYTTRRLFGFVFVNSRTANVFTPDVLPELDLFAHLVALIILNEIAAVRTLLAAIRTARDMTSQRDAETGRHVDRMARYSRLIAGELADRHGFDDEYIEHVFMFAPLHDIGKIAVADRILLKPGQLDADETRQMRSHVEKGRELVDAMLKNFGLDSVQHVEMLLNIVQHHHESPDGSGYPRGLKGSEIPIEARIVAVADVFDALTCARPYKEPWQPVAAFDALRRLAGSGLDAECVEALSRRRQEVERIRQQFADPQAE